MSFSRDPCITGQEQQAVSDGYRVMVERLSPGAHTLLAKVDFAGQHFETSNTVTIGETGDDE